MPTHVNNDKATFFVCSFGGVNKVLTSISINVVSFRLTIFGNNRDNRVPTGVSIDSLCILRNIPGENNVLNMYEE